MRHDNQEESQEHICVWEPREMRVRIKYGYHIVLKQMYNDRHNMTLQLISTRLTEQYVVRTQGLTQMGCNDN